MEVLKNLVIKSFAPVPSALESFKNWWNGYQDAFFASEVVDIIGKVIGKGSLSKAPETSPQSQASHSRRKLKRTLNPGICSSSFMLIPLENFALNSLTFLAQKIPSMLLFPGPGYACQALPLKRQRPLLCLPALLMLLTLLKSRHRLTPADMPPSPKLSSVPSNAPSAVPTPCVSKPVSSLAEDASNASEFNDLSSDDVIDGPEPSLLPS